MNVIFTTIIANNLISKEAYNQNIVKLLIHYFEYCKSHFQIHTKVLSKSFQNSNEVEPVNDSIINDLCESASTVNPSFENAIINRFNEKTCESYWIKILLDEFDNNKQFLTPLFFRFSKCIERSIPEYDDQAIISLIKMFVLK